MWKPLTGEPYAGKPHVRFGGRGGAEPSLPLFRALRKGCFEEMLCEHLQCRLESRRADTTPPIFLFPSTSPSRLESRRSRVGAAGFAGMTQAQVTQLLKACCSWGAGQWAAGILGFREGYDVANRVAIG